MQDDLEPEQGDQLLQFQRGGKEVERPGPAPFWSPITVCTPHVRQLGQRLILGRGSAARDHRTSHEPRLFWTRLLEDNPSHSCPKSANRQWRRASSTSST